MARTVRTSLVDVDTPTGTARLHVSAVSRPRALVVLGHGAGRGVDTADLLGWYEVVYEDGFVITVPLRSEVNILDWQAMHRKNSVSYPFQATAVEVGALAGQPATFYAWEWTNPRLGKVIREVRLKGTSGFKRFDGSAISNGVVLAGVSYVPKREVKTKAGPRD